MPKQFEVGRALTEMPTPINPDVRSLFEFCNADHFKSMSDEQLSKHITDIRDRAYSIAPWPCMGWFRFMPPPIRKGGVLEPTSTYEKVSQHLRQHPDAKVLDFGCCFAHDARQLVRDGVKPEQIVNADLVTELIDLGFELFGDGRESKHIRGMRFEKADVFNEQDVKKLEVPGGYHAIYVGSFIHLFDLEHQEKCVAVLDRLLSKQPGSIIFGGQTGRDEGKAGPRESRQEAKRGPTGVPKNDSGTSPPSYVHDCKTLPALFERAGTSTGRGWDAKIEIRERELPSGDGEMLMASDSPDLHATRRICFAMERK